MSFSILPTELLHAISSHAPPRDLATLARISCQVSDAAIRHLYRHPELHLPPASVPEDAHRKLQLLRTLAARPDIAQLVRSFYITLGADSGADPEPYRLLARAVANMTELVSLTLRVDAAASWVLADPPRSTSPGRSIFRRLRYMSCPFPLDAHVTEFLSRASSLVELELDSIPSSLPDPSLPPRLPASAAPNLAHLVTSARSAQSIVPARPLRSVFIQVGDVDEPTLRALSRSSAPGGVAVLGATTSMRTIPFLEAVARHISPAHVKMSTTSAEFLAPPGEIFYNDVAAVLDTMPQLVALEISGMHWAAQASGAREKRTWQSTPFLGRWAPGQSQPSGLEFHNTALYPATESESEFDFFDYLG